MTNNPMKLRFPLPCRAACFTAAILTAGSLHAQATVYKRGATDTLRYREVTLGTVTAKSAQGAAELTTKQESTIALILGAGVSAQAWYEALLIESTTPTGPKKPATTAMLRQPFSLNIDARGRVKVVSTPTMTAELKAVTDLRHQFDDFLIRLPAQSLNRNFEWTDTNTVTNSDASGEHSRLVSIAHYRVLSDTTVNGERGVVLRMVQDMKLEAGGPVEGQPLKAESALAGRDSGTVVFSVTSGKMLARDRHGDLKGTLTYTGGAQPIALQQQYQYQTVITLQKR